MPTFEVIFPVLAWPNQVSTCLMTAPALLKQNFMNICDPKKIW